MSPRQNRVDPWGDLVATPERGLLFTGNRGCLVDAEGRMVRHHQAQAWITCLLQYRENKVGLDRPNAWTPIFFLDDAVALAAGHRPCGLCRREAYRSYQDALSRAQGADAPGSATALDRRLAGERRSGARGAEQGRQRVPWEADGRELPDGTVILVEDVPRLLRGDFSFAFSFAGWHSPLRRPAGAHPVDVLTPPTTVAALGHGFEPCLHESSRSPGHP